MPKPGVIRQRLGARRYHYHMPRSLQRSHGYVCANPFLTMVQELPA